MRLLLLLIISFYSIAIYAQDDGINWMTWDEAINRSKTDSVPKKMFIDFYTGWCGWCKRMDATTFKDNGVVSYMNCLLYTSPSPRD